MVLTFNRASHVFPRAQLFNGNPLFNKAFDGFFVDARKPSADDAKPSTLAARFDVIDKEDRFEARIEIPGVAKEDIDVQIDGAVVRVRAEAKKGEPAAASERILHSNRTTRSWARNFTLPAEVSEERAEARYENGVLTLTLPKKEVAQPKRVEIK